MEKSITPFVSLVGAGPGDPDLLTVKALRLIQQATAIAYDRLVSPEVMALCNPDAELIFVGKKRDKHCVPQDQINQLLVDKALEGKHVVRLKGGDPFIFGRGGEELEVLIENGVKFDVVPGITAASGCSAYAGIPLTHRDHAQSVQFITGHLKASQTEAGELEHQNEVIQWKNLTAVNKTLVFYMGIKQAPIISEKLIENGLSGETLCAIIENGTTPKQRVITGKLSELSEMSADAVSPSLIIVGGVVSLHNKLNVKKLTDH